MTELQKVLSNVTKPQAEALYYWLNNFAGELEDMEAHVPASILNMLADIEIAIDERRS